MAKIEGRVVLFGAGNLAHHLAPALNNAGYKIVQIVSRNMNTAGTLAKNFGARADTEFSKIISDADYYFICVNDSQIENVIKSCNPADKFLIHTSGSTAMNIFDKYCSRYGVIYPLQTFTKDKQVEMLKVPFFIEASSSSELEDLTYLASGISENVRTGNSEQRLFLHICAVFTCAFANHMYRIADSICTDRNLPFDFLHPLLLETAEKAIKISPNLAQTGPAARNEMSILEKHIKQLAEFPEFQKIYTFVTSSILTMNGHSADFLKIQSERNE